LYKVLVEKGAAVNAVDNDAESALMTAASKGRYSAVVYRIKNGVDVRLKTVIPPIYCAGLPRCRNKTG
jgi:hypothetical protein